MYNPFYGKNRMNKPLKERTFFVLIILSMAVSICPLQISDVKAAQLPENNTGAVLCSPSVYIQTPDDCVPLGPSQYLTELAQQGMQWPLQPLDVSHPDPALGDLSSSYFKVDKTGTTFYPSLDAAISKKGASGGLAPGDFFYVVYTERIDLKKGTYYYLPSGAYIPGDGSDSKKITAPFLGVEVHSPPKNDFGFVWNPTDIRREPNEMSYNLPLARLDFERDKDGNVLYPLRYPILRIYSSEIIEGTKWYLIGPEQWVLARDIAAVIPNATPPNGVINGRWIDVNLEQQTLAVYDQGQMVFATVIATGRAPKYFTRPGLFTIYKKKELETMQGLRGTSDFYYLEDVPWTMYFDKARALHGAYWRARMGYIQSHGCVNLTPGDAHWLFDWASEGDWVYVHDPSGLTPTDPSFYGDGGGS